MSTQYVSPAVVLPLCLEVCRLSAILALSAKAHPFCSLSGHVQTFEFCCDSSDSTYSAGDFRSVWVDRQTIYLDKCKSEQYEWLLNVIDFLNDFIVIEQQLDLLKTA